MASTFRNLKNLQAEISFKLNHQELENFKQQIFMNNSFKELALDDVLENNILTGNDYKLACSLTKEDLYDLSEIKGYVPESPLYMKIISSLSGQEITIKIPSLKDQVVTRIICYFLEPYVYSIPSPFGSGLYSENSIYDVFPKIETILYCEKPKYASMFKLEVQNPDFFKNAILNEVPIEKNLISELVDQGHISIRSLYGEHDALNLFPTISGLCQTVVLKKGLNNLYLNNSFIMHNKNEFLILSKNENTDLLLQLENILGIYGLKIEQESLKTNSVDTYFTYLGKTYYLQNDKLQFEEEGTINDSIVKYFSSVTGTPFTSSSLVNNELNKLILLLNTYYKGADVSDQLLNIKEALVYNHFKNSIKGSPEEIEDMIVSHKDGREIIENVIGSGTPLYELGDNGPYISSVPCNVKRHPKCMVCGRYFKRGETARKVEGLENEYVHESCYEGIYDSIKRLGMYFEFDFNRYLKNMETLKENSGSEKIRTKGIKSDWKYYPLYKFLSELEENEITLSFNRIERILKSKLPPSLKSGREQWFNFSRNDLTIRSSWEKAGFEMAYLNVPEKIVTFQKRKVGIHQINTLGIDKIEVPIEVKKTVDKFFSQFINKHSLKI